MTKPTTARTGKRVWENHPLFKAAKILILIPFILSPFSFLIPVINCATKAQWDDVFLPCLCFCSFSRKNFSQCALDWDFCQDFYGLQRRQTVHFLGIGKTGGSTIKHALKRPSVTREHVIRRHGHRKTVREIPVGEKVIFFLRDLLSRFVSGLYNRLRQGRPKYSLLHVGSMPNG